jgi:hypothetical protein
VRGHRNLASMFKLHSLHNLVLFVIAETLDLRNNLLAGAIPASLYSMSGLEDALLGGNSFVGNISADISQMNSLRQLNLALTQMGGEIPPEVFRLGSLEELYLGSASFEGELSNEFSLLNGTIREISLENNAFSGEFPSLFETMAGLGELSLSSESFFCHHFVFCVSHNSLLHL